jgi:putative phosphoesterase
VTTRVVVLADTHMRVGARRHLPEPVYRLLDDADVIIHAGDLCDGSVLATLETFAPTIAVLGNNDASLEGRLPVTTTVELAGVTVAVVHDSGPRAGRERRLHRRFPEADVVVFGHSHIPVDMPGVDGQRLFNPGSPTERRRQPHHTAGVLELHDGTIRTSRIVVVDD